MNTEFIVNKALVGIDEVGFRLEELGITDKFNRHTALAFVMAEQRRLEGELDSWTARVDRQKARINLLRRQAESTLNTGIEIATTPLRKTIGLVKSRLN